MCHFEPNFEGKTLKIVDLDKNKDLALKKAYPNNVLTQNFTNPSMGTDEKCQWCTD